MRKTCTHIIYMISLTDSFENKVNQYVRFNIILVNLSLIRAHKCTLLYSLIG